MPRAAEYGALIAAMFAVRLLSVYVWKLPDGDVDEYRGYALAFWNARPFLHALPVEYPPLAILPFTLTILPPLPDYHAVYSYWMGALVLLGYAGFARYSTRWRGVVFAIYLLVGAAATLLARFDLVPGLVSLAALWAAERRRFSLAYVLLAVGVLLKLYPIFLLPALAIEQWCVVRALDCGEPVWAEVIRQWHRPRSALRTLWAHPSIRRVTYGLGLCLGIIVLGFLGAIALSPSGALSGFSYAGNRPLQVESTPASLLWLGTVFGVPAAPQYSFLSLNYVGVLDVVLKPLSAVALLGGCLWVYWRQLRGSLSVGQAFVACLCVVIATNKIFSPQYLIWLLPVVASVEGFDLVWLAICLLTTIEYPLIYQLRHPIWTVTFSWQFMPVLALRNGLLLYATFRVIMRPRARRRSAGDGNAPTDAAGAAIQPDELAEAQPDERESQEPALIG